MAEEKVRTRRGKPWIILYLMLLHSKFAEMLVCQVAFYARYL